MKSTVDNFGKAEMMIRRPVHKVFTAFIDPTITRKFWFKNLSSVEWKFTALTKDQTLVSIVNSGLKAIGDDLFSAVRDSTEGFTLVLAGAKAWLEHQIQLNLVVDKHPNGLG